MTNRPLSRRALLSGLAASTLTACSSQAKLSPAPAISISNRTDLGTRANPSSVNVLYFTDRQFENGNFTAGRSRSFTFGESTITLGDKGPDMLRSVGLDQPPLFVTRVTEVGKLPTTPIPFDVVNGRAVNLPAENNAYLAAEARMRAMMAQYVRASRTGEVLLLIPGFDVPFDDGLTSLTSLWYHTDRDIVPMLYSWPSGSDGLLGYLTDRESGEFTIFHLKQFLRVLASTPGLRRIHVVAHSRGAAVATAALRELIIEDRARGLDPINTLKIENLILAAPDVSFDIVGQRLVAERFGLAFGRLTVYINQSDSALELAQRLAAGVRFGRLEPEDVPENEQVIFGNLKKVNFIRVSRAGTRFGHSYYINNARVLSDIIQLIRTRADPGTPQRPLQLISGNFYLLPDSYLANGVPS